MAEKHGLDAEGEVDNVPSLVPPGIYNLAFAHWWTGILFGRSQKLAITFRVMDLGEYFETPLQRWYNVTVRGKTGRNGAFKVGWGSDLLREYVTLVGKRERADRIALSAYRGLIISAEVGTVDTSRAQGKLPPELHYSVIRRLISVEAGKRAA